jgi:hypothetical protein
MGAAEACKGHRVLAVRTGACRATGQGSDLFGHVGALRGCAELGRDLAADVPVVGRPAGVSSDADVVRLGYTRAFRGLLCAGERSEACRAQLELCGGESAPVGTGPRGLSVWKGCVVQLRNEALLFLLPVRLAEDGALGGLQYKGWGSR